MGKIHPTAFIDKSAEIDEDVEIGQGVYIGPKVYIGKGTIIKANTYIECNTKIGKNNIIGPFVVIGTPPQHIAYKGEETWVEIGDNNIIREFVTIHRGTLIEKGITKIGNKCFLMSYVHIAHDCNIGDHNIFANNVGVAGHVNVGDHVIVGGNAGIHQFCRIDSYSMIGGAALILKDVPAYEMASGNPARAFGMNIEGMRRKGWSRNTIQGLREAYKLIYKSGLTTEQAIEKIRNEILESTPEAQLFIDSLEKSTRGIVR